jgi:hypothetical protein
VSLIIDRDKWADLKEKRKEKKAIKELVKEEKDILKGLE